MIYNGLADFVKYQKSKKQLITIDKYVNPELEIAEVYDRVVKSSSEALLFTNNGTKFPLLINMFGSDERMSDALYVKNLDEIGERIETLFKDITAPKETLWEKLKMLPQLAKVASFMPKNIAGKGVCQENIINNPDLNIFPILKCWPFDGGKFITFPLVHTVNPTTGAKNMGMYRMQVFDKTTTGMHWHLHKTGAMHFEEYKKLNKRMPVTVVLGGDPVYTYCATAPLPENVDEYILAGFLRQKSVEMVKCITNDLWVPSDADIVIEGYVDPTEEFAFEGPFGDHTGYYSLPDYYPKFHISCITHRNDAIYPATVVGIAPQEDKYLGIATERIFLTPIRLSMLPEVEDMYLPSEGGFHNIAIVKIKKQYPGQAQKVMNSLWGAGQMMFNKIMIVVDGNIDIRNGAEIIKAFVENVEISRDILISQGPSDALDHASYNFAFGGKIGIDATVKQSKLTYKNTEISDFQNILNSLSINIIGKYHTRYPFVLINSTNNAKELLKKNDTVNILFNAGISCAIIIDSDMFIDNDTHFTWRLSNNIDPFHDISFVKSNNINTLMIVDATAKSKSTTFTRDWPNIVVSDIQTIKKIDEIWDSFGIGTFVESPSLQFIKERKIISAFYFE